MRYDGQYFYVLDGYEETWQGPFDTREEAIETAQAEHPQSNFETLKVRVASIFSYLPDIESILESTLDAISNEHHEVVVDGIDLQFGSLDKTERNKMTDEVRKTIEKLMIDYRILPELYDETEVQKH